MFLQAECVVCVCVESSDSISPDLICSAGKQTDVYWRFSLYTGVWIKKRGVFAEIKGNMIPKELDIWCVCVSNVVACVSNCFAFFFSSVFVKT